MEFDFNKIVQVRKHDGRESFTIPAKLRHITENCKYFECVETEEGILYKPVVRG